MYLNRAGMSGRPFGNTSLILLPNLGKIINIHKSMLDEGSETSELVQEVENEQKQIAVTSWDHIAPTSFQSTKNSELLPKLQDTTAKMKVWFPLP